MAGRCGAGSCSPPACSYSGSSCAICGTDRTPLVDLSLVQDKHFRGGLSAQLMLGLLCGLYFMTWALYLQWGLGMSPAVSGSAFVLLALGELAGATLAAKTAGRSARRLPQTGVIVALAAITVYGLQTGYGAGSARERRFGLGPVQYRVPTRRRVRWRADRTGVLRCHRRLVRPCAEP